MFPNQSYRFANRIWTSLSKCEKNRLACYRLIAGNYIDATGQPFLIRTANRTAIIKNIKNSIIPIYLKSLCHAPQGEDYFFHKSTFDISICQLRKNIFNIVIFHSNSKIKFS